MGYLSQSIQLNLFQTINTKLETPKRTNQKDYKPQPYIFRKSRKRIELRNTSRITKQRILR